MCTCQVAGVRQFPRQADRGVQPVLELRTGLDPTDLLSSTAGRVSLALVLAAYEQWLKREEATFPELLAASFNALRAFFDTRCC